MIFHKTWQQVLDGTKTQTRRLKKPRDRIMRCKKSKHNMVCVWNDRMQMVRWEVGKSYAVQPGRGELAVGRFVLKKIRRERLQDISTNGVVAEGIKPYTLAKGVLADDPPDPRWKFIELWDSIHPKGFRWEDNPEVWVLDIEVE